MECDFRSTGIYVPAIDLWLDSREPVPTNWISHAHSDHARPGHDRIFTSPATGRLFEIRYGAAPGLEPHDFLDLWEHNGARLTAYPAGHILGAAQLLIEFQGERLVYTGDIKLQPPLLGDATELVACDRLIIESTFGLPIFRFLDRVTAIERIRVFARECLDEGVTPVFFGYPLGRGQEIVSALSQSGIPSAVHGAIAKMIPEYQRAGYTFADWIPYSAETLVDGRALVLVPGMRETIEAASFDYRIAYVSGWASMDNARARSGADELIPYSDHAGFAELLELVDQSGAKRIDVVHGYTEAFARILRGRGFDAQAAQVAGAREEGEDS